ncbi:MAG: UbiX family flavin prenyltransferase [Bacteroidales bacterium]|jgi:flavin prenyltransferase|nr:UbiX family flavin prenyltransferase [Bacteroidales bacterium]
MEKQRVVVGVTGASGQIYAKYIIEKLRQTGGIELDIIFTDTAREVYTDETGEPLPSHLIDNNSYYNRNASGSNPASVFIIIPCTMGTIGRIASGSSEDLISRIADVQLKERRKLIIVPRETPYSLIHLRNMTLLTEAGAIIAPASPSFYMHPGTLPEMVDNFVLRILDIARISEMPAEKKWLGASSNFLKP